MRSHVRSASPPSWLQRHRAALLVVLCLLLAPGYFALAVPFLNAPVEQQITVTGHPFVISDLFPRWLGARALLHGQDPYGATFRQELHRLYYGRPMSAEDESRLFGTICEFFYPPYVALPLLPLLWLPFEVVRWLSTALLAACLVASVVVWLRTLEPKASARWQLAVSAFALVFFPSLVTLWLQQLAALVLLYLVGGYALAAKRRYAWAGAVLALAFIKPQLAIIPAAGLLFWSLWRRERWGLPLAFFATMAAQLALAQLLLPGWLGEFVQATARYQLYNRLSYWLPGILAGSTSTAILFVVLPLGAILLAAWWRHRDEPLAAPPNTTSAALTFAAAATLMPDMDFYNKILLLVPLISLAHAGVGSGPVRKATARITWLAAGASFLAPALRGWERLAGRAMGMPVPTDVSAVATILQASLVLLPCIVVLAVIPVCFGGERSLPARISRRLVWPLHPAAQNAPAA